MNMTWYFVDVNCLQLMELTFGIRGEHNVGRKEEFVSLSATVEMPRKKPDSASQEGSVLLSAIPPFTAFVLSTLSCLRWSFATAKDSTSW